MFTKEAQELAEATVEAIKKIAGSVERECPKCRGLGKFPLSKERIVAAPRYTHIKCPACNGTGKVKGKWEWEPEVGEWFMDAKLGPYLIYVVGDCFIKIAKDNGETCSSGMSDKFIPLLHWEKIEEILEGMGYKVWTNKFYDDPRGKYLCKIAMQYRESTGARFIPPEEVSSMRANSAQEAVMRAAIELGKEKK